MHDARWIAESGCVHIDRPLFRMEAGILQVLILPGVRLALLSDVLPVEYSSVFSTSLPVEHRYELHVRLGALLMQDPCIRLMPDLNEAPHEIL